MAIYHLSAQVISRGAGRSVVAAAAYRAATRLEDARTGVAHDFTAKDHLVHAEVLLPDGAPTAWTDRGTLWNVVEASEKRKDAQLAREVEFALPRELSQAEGTALARDFVREQFVARGMVADLCVHRPVGEDGEAKPHAHVLLTLRGVAPGQQADGSNAAFGAKQREWNSTALLQTWRTRWAELANERLASLGHDARIDHRSLAAQGIPLEPQHKVGPAGMRRAARGEAAERRAEHDAIARRNGARIAADPDLALDALTRQQSTFTRQDLARFIARHSDGAAQFAQVLAKVEAAPALVRLGEDAAGRTRWTTREMLAAERRMEGQAAALVEGQVHGVTARRRDHALRQAESGGLTLSVEQRDAVRHLTDAEGLALVVGYAGTGKSALLGVARDAWEAQGLRVRGATLSGIAAEGLQAGSGISSKTLASLEWHWARGRDVLGPRDVLVVDEAGMVGSRQMQRVLEQAQQAGAKVVLVGDPEQLQAIEAGAAFRALAERHGAAEISEVRRQRQDWQREATRELATSRTAEALARYEQAGMVLGHATQEEARAALVEGWLEGRQQDPARSQLMLASTRADAAALNRLAREQLGGAGALGPDHRIATEQGERSFAAGDRLMFLRNERALGASAEGQGGAAVKNGTLGTVTSIQGQGEAAQLTVRLDTKDATTPAAEVTFAVRDYGALTHGYAATIHKAQGVTVERAHVLASRAMDRHAAYVALTRHRDGVRLHWARDELGSREGLTRRLSRQRAKDVTLDYAGPEGERRAREAFASRRGLHPLAPESEIIARSPVERARASGETAAAYLDRVAAQVEPPAPPLLPAQRDPTGRDSLGRGTTPQEIAAAEARDPAVRREAVDRTQWLRAAYRDPVQAEAQLDALLWKNRDDRNQVAHQLREQPELLGRLRGGDGLFSGRGAQLERASAVSAVRSVASGLEREAAARQRAGETYQTEVAAQRVRDAVEVPGLSQRAWRAVEALEQARAASRPPEANKAPQAYWQALAGRPDPALAEAWQRVVRRQPEVAAELRAVAAAAEQRLRPQGVEQSLTAKAAEAVAPSRKGLAGIGRAVAVLREGQRAVEAQERIQARTQEAEQQRLGIRRAPGLGR
ncbi:Ti-type conjugative transfer relaxase TraA [Pseudoroseomonas ludipueritiae]|uniref:Ti-type conjugative transfer relaxase TraA n=1 Tax=Pseudoroseomonas ludipueritiae TaxID=198093 RepID=A0ABR7RBQ0_9PROT|nr:Ti-type conjugative transfer relaxase TraA [Pseudoroseomonas ludipueritiae]MBC9179114.1 Ti-type conjugative transfer relaxase TraA [Pseudoroseomonas ludipueritiae]